MGYHTFVSTARTLAILLPLMAASTGVCQQRPGFTAHFLGWNPDSSDFAYILRHHRRARFGKGMRTPRDRYFMKRTSRSGVAQRMALKHSVSARVKARRYAVIPVTGQRLSPFVQAFPMGNGLTLRFQLEVGKRRLSYAYWLDDVTRPGEPRRLLRGYLDEVWTDIEATVYRSPDRAWVTVLLAMSTPYRSEARVEGMRIRSQQDAKP